MVHPLLLSLYGLVSVSVITICDCCTWGCGQSQPGIQLIRGGAHGVQAQQQEAAGLRQPRPAPCPDHAAHSQGDAAQVPRIDKIIDAQRLEALLTERGWGQQEYQQPAPHARH